MPSWDLYGLTLLIAFRLMSELALTLVAWKCVTSTLRWQCLWKRKQPYVFMGKVCTSSERLTFYVFSYMFYTGETKPSNLQIVQSHWWFWANFGTQLVRNDQNYRQAWKPYSSIDKQTLEQNTHPMLVLRKYVNRWRGFCFQIHQRFVVFPNKTLDLFSCQMCLMVWGNLWDPAASKPSQSFNNNKKHA